MNTPVLPAHVEECKKLDTLDFAAEIPALWRRYRQLQAARTRTKSELAAARLDLGCRLLQVHEYLANGREFSTWLRFHDINRSSAYRAMDQAAGRTRPKMKRAHCPTWNAAAPPASGFLLAPAQLTVALGPGDAHLLRQALARELSGGVSEVELIDRICHSLARLAAQSTSTQAERIH